MVNPSNNVATTASSTSNYDLELHVLNRYVGEARLQRLLWIASHTTTPTPITGDEGVIGGASADDNNNNNGLLQLQRSAYEAAIQHSIQENNTVRYKDIFHHYNQQQELLHSTNNNNETAQHHESVIRESTSMITSGLLSFDTHWYHETCVFNRQHSDILQSRLQASQAHLNKDSIRIAYLALAEFYAKTGSLTDAFHAVLRAKDYCTTRQQTTIITLQMLQYSILLRNYHTVRDYIPRLEHTVVVTTASTTNTSTTTTATGSATSSSSTQQQQQQQQGGSGALGLLDPVFAATVRNNVLTAAGLAKLASREYKSAAEKFRAVALSGHNNNNNNTSNSTTAISAYSPESTGGGGISSNSTSYHTDWDTNVLAPEDIALYASFISLAVEDNPAVIMQLAEDAEALELVPAMKEILIQFTRLANYRVAYAILEQQIFPILKHDLYLGGQHLHTLIQQIQHRAIFQYWKPYQKVQLHIMATELGNGIIRPPSLSSSSSNSIIPTPHLNPTVEGINSASPASNMLLQTLIQLMITNRYALGYDTRLDLLNNALVRDTKSIEYERLTKTSNHLQTVSRRVVNDTFGMILRTACFDSNTKIIDPAIKKQQQLQQQLQQLQQLQQKRQQQQAGRSVVVMVELVVFGEV